MKQPSDLLRPVQILSTVLATATAAADHRFGVRHGSQGRLFSGIQIEEVQRHESNETTSSQATPLQIWHDLSGRK